MKSLIISIIALILVIALAVVACIGRTNRDEKEYNNGICPLCGEKYHLVGGHGWHTQYYIYECTKCGHTIETTHRMR